MLSSRDTVAILQPNSTKTLSISVYIYEALAGIDFVHVYLWVGGSGDRN